jgi:DNA-binding phage protein
MTPADPWRAGAMPELTLIGRLRLALASSKEGLQVIARRAEVPRQTLARFVAGEHGLTFAAASAVVKALGLQPVPTRPPRRS